MTLPQITEAVMDESQITKNTNQNVSKTMNTVAQNAVARLKNAGNAMASLLFRCRHRSLSVPFTPVSKSGQPSAATYVKCLDCGAKFYYDWNKMSIGRPMPTLPYAYSNVHLQAFDLPNASRGLNVHRV
jgi:hypothetical protein